jgi:dolichol-phosphate mannosyltransferase
VGYVKQARWAGRSKWTLRKKVKLLADSVISFSFAPIRFMSWFGFFLALCGFAYAIAVVVGWLVGYVVAGTGFAALMTVLLIGQGSILMAFGIIGEYLWRTFDEARGRPRYIFEEYIIGDRISVAAAASLDCKSAENSAVLVDANNSRPNLEVTKQ